MADEAGKGRKRKARVAAPCLDPLAAWGEAFMNSIEGPRSSAGSRQRKPEKPTVSAPVDAASQNSASLVAAHGTTDSEERLDAGAPARRRGAGARKRARLRHELTNPTEKATQGVAPKTSGAAIGGKADGIRSASKNELASASVRSEHPQAATKQDPARPRYGAIKKGFPAATPVQNPIEKLLTPVQNPIEKLLGMPLSMGSGVQRDSAKVRPPSVSKAEQRRFMSGNVSSIRSGPKEQTKPRNRQGEPTEEDAEFNKVVRDVLDWVNPQLGRREQKQYEEARIRALGGTLEKRVRQPYKMLQEHRKNADATRARKLKEEEILGVQMNASAHRAGWAVDRALKKKKEFLKEKKARQEDGLLRLGMGGYEKRGMVTIPMREIRNAQKK